MQFADKFPQAREAHAVAMTLPHAELSPIITGKAKGEVFIDLIDGKTGETLESRHIPNVITADASILAAILFTDPSSRSLGANMLAVGTGATGALLSPDAPDPDQRKLNAEIERKAFSSYTFRDSSGNAVAIPTNIVDWTVTYDEAEAVGPLNEMGILATISSNPLVANPNPNTYPTRDTTVDLTRYDILVNYLTFSVISKSATARLRITWRITF
jgi:hypothetical protein